MQSFEVKIFSLTLTYNNKYDIIDYVVQFNEIIDALRFKKASTICFFIIADGELTYAYLRRAPRRTVFGVIYEKSGLL